LINKFARYDRYFAGKGQLFAPDVEAKPVPVPIGGWDAISPLAAMEPKYAVILDNWIPRTGWVEFRGGYNAWCQNLADETVDTLLAYRPMLGAEQLFAWLGTEIWNVSDYGLPSLSVSGLTNSRAQGVNFTPGGGISYLLTVNGSDPYRGYNGTTWAILSVTGINSSTFININVFKRRIWFVEDNSTSIWYLDVDAISGPATKFNVGPLLSRGSKIIAMGTWTVDGGNGPDDLAVFASNKGQLVIYKGTDPSSANSFALVGVFDLAIPLGNRCFCKLGSDLLINTLNGVIPISQALPFDPSAVRSVAITNRIQNAMLTAAVAGKELFGWQGIVFSQQSLFILNVPIQESTVQQQFVMNTITGAWARITGWNANCFEIYNESLYFGDNNGNVNLAYAGSLDLVDSIESDMKCAFNYFGDPGRTKQMNLIRPLIVADGNITPTISVDVDFGNTSSEAPVSLLTPVGALWDISLWDFSTWSAGVSTVNNWLTIFAMGTALAVRMKVNLGGVGTSQSIASQSIFDTGVFDTAVFDGNGATLQSGQGLVTLQINSFQSVMQFGLAV